VRVRQREWMKNSAGMACLPDYGRYCQMNGALLNEARSGMKLKSSDD
jgi:hypothetical protein